VFFFFFFKCTGRLYFSQKAHEQLKCLFDWNKSPFKVGLVDIVPL